MCERERERGERKRKTADTGGVDISRFILF